MSNDIAVHRTAPHESRPRRGLRRSGHVFIGVGVTIAVLALRRDMP